MRVNMTDDLSSIYFIDFASVLVKTYSFCQAIESSDDDFDDIDQASAFINLQPTMKSNIKTTTKNEDKSNYTILINISINCVNILCLSPAK